MPELGVEEILLQQGCAFEVYEHAPVYTCAQAAEALAGVSGVAVKNLFLKDTKQQFFMVVVDEKKRVDLKALSKKIGAGKFSFGNEAELKDVLGLTPGAVSMLALINDRQKRVRLLVDTEAWGEKPIHCHPLVNTKTLLVTPGDLEKFLASTGHAVELIEIPEARI